jgi:hypothetical protein
VSSTWLRAAGAVLAVAAMTTTAAVASRAATAPPGPSYAADGRLLFPKDYRTWVFLSSGMDMSYVDAPAMAGMTMFDNVFVNPEAYAAFQKTGTWPDRTVLVLEARGGQQKGSINKRGHFQTDRMAMEVHVKDTARFKGGWAFFSFEGEGPGKLFPTTAACYSCHEQHAAVDTTFVQFYPTLLPIARANKTLSPAYVREESQ